MQRRPAWEEASSQYHVHRLCTDNYIHSHGIHPGAGPLCNLDRVGGWEARKEFMKRAW